MFWILTIATLWAVFILLILPFARTESNADITTETARKNIATYKNEIARIDASLADSPDPGLEAEKVRLQRKVLHFAKQSETDSRLSGRAILSIGAVLTAGTFGLYMLVGRPDLLPAYEPNESTTVVAERPDIDISASSASDYPIKDTEKNSQADTRTIDDLLLELETLLNGEQSESVEGWVLYARTLIRVERYDEGLNAYQKALDLTQNNPQIADEYARAQAYVSAQKNPQAAPESTQEALTRPPAPSQEQIAVAQQMSEEDRQAMIAGMVEGLAARLEDNPDDLYGWVRLLSSRRTLGQTEQLDADIAAMKAHYGEDETSIRRILIYAQIKE